MAHQTFNNKRIIWESRTKQIALIRACFLFAVIDIWTQDKSSVFAFWGAMILFGGGGIFLLIRLLNSKNLFVTNNTKLGKEILVQQLLNAQRDVGYFSYTDFGFNLGEDGSDRIYDWSEIETIFAFKADWITTDEIYMDIFTSDKSSLRLTESTPGWYQFIKRLSENIPGIPASWDEEIAILPFEAKLTMLFDKSGRTLKQAEAACYAE